MYGMSENPLSEAVVQGSSLSLHLSNNSVYSVVKFMVIVKVQLGVLEYTLKKSAITVLFSKLPVRCRVE